MGAAIRVCPAAAVDAPLDRVWPVLLDSQRYGDWADARFTRFDPLEPGAEDGPRHLKRAAATHSPQR
jgi:hypothetical protein